PDRIDAQVAKIIQPRSNSVDVANAIPIRILEAARVDLVNDRVLPPRILRSCLRFCRRVLRFQSLLRRKLRPAWGCREAKAEGDNREEKFNAVQHGCSPCSCHISIAWLKALRFHESATVPPI